LWIVKVLLIGYIGSSNHNNDMRKQLATRCSAVDCVLEIFTTGSDGLETDLDVDVNGSTKQRQRETTEFHQRKWATTAIGFFHRPFFFPVSRGLLESENLSRLVCSYRMRALFVKIDDEKCLPAVDEWCTHVNTVQKDTYLTGTTVDTRLGVCRDLLFRHVSPPSRAWTKRELPGKLFLHHANQAAASVRSSPSHLQHHSPDNMSNRSPFDEYANRMRAVAQRSGRGFGGMPGGSPRGFGAGLAGVLLVGGAAWVFQSALFNVDGGHRAIKYQRTKGVSKEIYGEGATRHSAVNA
jgi:hypothetical protein